MENPRLIFYVAAYRSRWPKGAIKEEVRSEEFKNLAGEYEMLLGYSDHPISTFERYALARNAEFEANWEKHLDPNALMIEKLTVEDSTCEATIEGIELLPDFRYWVGVDGTGRREILWHAKK